MPRCGFLRLRAELETSGEIFGCSLDELRDRAAIHPPQAARGWQPKSPLEAFGTRWWQKGIRTPVRTFGLLPWPLPTD